MDHAEAAVRVVSSTVLAFYGIASVLATLPVRLSAPQGPQVEIPTSVSQTRTATLASPVIVELFTSEGCSDCPPADQLLYRLEQTQPVPAAQIIALEQHVDYWDYEGWRDPFSSSQFTRRQKDYVQAFNLPTAYTPEMVIDGTTEFVGSDGRRAVAAIERAALTPKANLQIERRAGATDGPKTAHLRVSLPTLGSWNPKHGADVVIAITEDDLTSDVSRGENAGAHLNHRAVVRELRLLGRVASSVPFSAEPDLNLAEDWKLENLHAVVFAQDRSTRQVLGASTVPLTEGKDTVTSQGAHR